MTLKLQRRSAFGWPASGAGWANPTRGIAVHYEGADTGIAGWSHGRCKDHWRDTRRFHVNQRGWADIGYSFGVCPHGYVLEGRGLNRQQAAQPGGNSTWYSCTFMTGPGEQPHPNQVEAFRELRAWLMGKGIKRAIRPHSSFVATGCPGDILRRLIRNGTLAKAPGATSIPKEDDMPEPKELWTWDGIPVPSNFTEEYRKENPNWQARYALSDTWKYVRLIHERLAAQNATIDKLVDAVAAGPGVDVEALKQEIRDAIESVEVRLDVPES